MAAKKFLRLINGVLTEIFGVQTSAGASNAGDLVSLDDSGRIDGSMMPVGIGADTATVQTSEALAAGDFVNIWNDSGSPRVRKADATTAGKEAHGFVLAAVSGGNNATVYLEGTNTQVSSMTAGNVFLQTTAGAGGATPPSASGNVVQRLGVAVSATAVSFEPSQPITLA